MTHLGDWMSEELEGLRQIRDELRVQAELGRAEFRDRWEDLEKRWHQLERKLKLLSSEAREEAEDVKEAARLLAKEIREGYQHLRSRL